MAVVAIADRWLEPRLRGPRVRRRARGARPSSESPGSPRQVATQRTRASSARRLEGPRVSSWRHLVELLRGRRWMAAAVVVVSVPAGLSESAVLVLVAEVAGAMVTRQARVHLVVGPLHASASIGRLLLIGAAVALARIALQGVLAYLPARVLADTQAALRRRLTEAFTRASWSVKSTEAESQLQELLTNQVVQATSAVSIALGLMTTAATLTVLVGSALVVGLVPALGVMGAGVALFAGLRPLAKVGSRRAKELSAAQESYAGAVSEATGLAEEAQVFGAGPAQERRLEGLADVIRRRYLFTSFLQMSVPGTYYGMVLLLLIGGLALLDANGGGRLVSLGAAVLLLVRAANYGQQLQGGYQSWKQTAPFLARLERAEATYRDGAVADGRRPVGKTPSITFERVCYSYGPGTPVLQEVSFEVKAGEAIGIVGPTGAGKSTLVQLLLGLREPTSGRYLIDGVTAVDLALAGSSGAFAYVPQEPRLLYASVADNIAFFRDIDRAAIEEAARLARIDGDIGTWPDGYDTLIGQRADAVSGGQRQRICLARALAGAPLALVLDEPTSSLDMHSESLVSDSLAGLRGRLTIFVVAHRLSTLAFCDRVMVMVDGRIEAFAPAEELGRTSGFYRRAVTLSAPGPSGVGYAEQALDPT